MIPIKDNWSKPRSNGNHLTQAEIGKLRVAFNCGREPRDIARELQCSSRVAQKYFGQFRGDGAYRRHKPEPRMVEPSPAPVQPRFYKSNFEL